MSTNGFSGLTTAQKQTNIPSPYEEFRGAFRQHLANVRRWNKVGQKMKRAGLYDTREIGDRMIVGREELARMVKENPDFAVDLILSKF